MPGGKPFYGLRQDALTAALRELSVEQRWRVFISIARNYHWLLDNRGSDEKSRLIGLRERKR